MKIKTIPLMILSLILSACMTVNVRDNTARQVANNAAKIADFDLPAGYSPEFSIHVQGYTVAGYSGEKGFGYLYLVQSENEADRKKLANMLYQVAFGSEDPLDEFSVIETQPVTIRGQSSTLVISEGVILTNSEGKTYHQAMVAFDGKGGPALLILLEPSAVWDVDTINALIASIR